MKPRKLPGRALVGMGFLLIAVVAAAGVGLAAGWQPGPSGFGGQAASPGASPSSDVAAASSLPASATANPPSGNPASSPSPFPLTSPSPSVPAAPISAAGFRPRATVVPMGFPLPASAKYRYGDGFRVARVGRPYWYNQIRSVTRNGTLLRAHDGQDLEVRLGTPVLATFEGLVVDPRTIWRPWQPSRYGNVVVVQSTEPTSVGYRAISAHLARLAVVVGGAVHRGQVIGWTGRTGNAAGTEAHLHFELRAPFMIEFHYAGVDRRLDVFDPRPSLRAADPRLS